MARGQSASRAAPCHVARPLPAHGWDTSYRLLSSWDGATEGACGHAEYYHKRRVQQMLAAELEQQEHVDGAPLDERIMSEYDRNSGGFVPGAPLDERMSEYDRSSPPLSE